MAKLQFLDLDNTTKVLNPKNITSFINTRGGTKTISIKGEADDITGDHLSPFCHIQNLTAEHTQ